MSMNSMRLQFVQNLHKLQMMERHISTNFIPFNGQIFDEDYFDHLISEIQEIRASERRFYQKVTDIYATSVDYDKNSAITKDGKTIRFPVLFLCSDSRF